MRQKNRQPRYDCFDYSGALPVLNIATLQIALKPFEHLTNADATLGQFMDGNFLDAAKELIANCVAVDVGEHLLVDDPATVDAAIELCVARGFAIGSQAYDEIVGFATTLPEIPAPLYSYTNIISLRLPYLHSIGVGYVRPNHGLPVQPKLWNRKLWSAYFAAYPGDAFRLTVLATVQRVAKLEPKVVTSRIHQLFPSFFPKAYCPEHVSWDKDSNAVDDIDDPSESWKR